MTKHLAETLVKEYGAPTKDRPRFSLERDNLDEKLRSFFGLQEKINRDAFAAVRYRPRTQEKNDPPTHVDLNQYPRLNEVADNLRPRWEEIIIEYLNGLNRKRSGERYPKEASSQEIEKWTAANMEIVNGKTGTRNWGNVVPKRSIFDTLFVPTAFDISGNRPHEFEQALNLILSAWTYLLAPNTYGSGYVGARANIAESFFSIDDDGKECSRNDCAKGQFTYFYKEYGPYIAYLVAVFQGEEQDRHYDGGDYTWSTHQLEEYLAPFKGGEGKSGKGGKWIVKEFVDFMDEANKVSTLPHAASHLGRLLSCAQGISKFFDIDEQTAEKVALEIACEHVNAAHYDGTLLIYRGKSTNYKPTLALTPFDWAKSCAGRLAQGTRNSHLLFWEQLASGEQVGITAQLGDTAMVESYADLETIMGQASTEELLRQLFKIPYIEHAQLLSKYLKLLFDAQSLTNNWKIKNNYSAEQKRLCYMTIADAECQKDSNKCDKPDLAALNNQLAASVIRMACYSAAVQIQHKSANSRVITPVKLSMDLHKILKEVCAISGNYSLDDDTAAVSAMSNDFLASVEAIQEQYKIISDRQTVVIDFRDAINQIEKLITHVRTLSLRHTCVVYGEVIKDEDEKPKTDEDPYYCDSSPLPQPTQDTIMIGINAVAQKYANEVEDNVKKRAGLAAFRFTIKPDTYKPSDFLKSTNPYTQASILSGAFMQALRGEVGKEQSPNGVRQLNNESNDGSQLSFHNVLALAKRLRKAMATAVPEVEARVLKARENSAGLMYTGYKLHTEKPVDTNAFGELSEMFGIKSTCFRLAHADDCLVGNLAPSSIEHIYVVRMLEMLGIVTGNRPHLQTALPGRLAQNGEAISLLAPLLLLGTEALDTFAPGAFSTASHNDSTDACIMAYDAGVRSIGHPFDREQMSGRTDKLAGATLSDFSLHALLGTILHDLEFDGPTGVVARRFLVPEATALLKKYDPQYGIDRARYSAKWIHEPGGEKTSTDVTLYDADGKSIRKTPHEKMVGVYVNAWKDSQAGGSNLCHEVQQLIADVRHVLEPVRQSHVAANSKEFDKHMKF